MKANPNAPLVENFSVKNKNGKSTFAKGDTLIVSFKATANGNNTLGKYFLEIHDEPASGKVSDEHKLVDAEFTNNFKALNSTTINHEVIIGNEGSNGKYHVHLHVYDSKNYAIAKTDEITVN